MVKNKYYVVLSGVLAMVLVFTQGAFAQIKDEDIMDQILVLKEYSKTGQNGKAIKLAQEILQFDPNNIIALNILTQTYIRMDNLPAAEETAKKALALKPDDPVTCRLLAVIYTAKAKQDPKAASDNLTLAQEQIQKGLVSKPDDILLLAGQAEIYFQQGYKDKAILVIDRALLISPNSEYLKEVKKMIEATKIEEKKPVDSP